MRKAYWCSPHNEGSYKPEDIVSLHETSSLGEVFSEAVEQP
jgi:hypothetical protein